MLNYRTARVFCLFVIATCVLSACSSTDKPLSNSARNQFITEFYAWVENVDVVEFESNVGPAIAIGAVEGALWSAHEPDLILPAALLTGLFSGLVTSIAEGQPYGYQYHLKAVDGDYVSITADVFHAEAGDCVRVVVAGDVRIYPVTRHACTVE